MPTRTRRTHTPSASPASTPLPADEADPAVSVLRRFRQVFNSVKTHFQQVEKQTGVGGAQLWALSLVRDHPGLGIKGLAAAMDIHQTTASNLVKALATAGLLRTQQGTHDRRSVELHLLPDGARVLRKAPGPLTGVLPDALARLDAETLQRLDRDLATLIAVLKADERAAGIPLAQM